MALTYDRHEQSMQQFIKEELDLCAKQPANLCGKDKDIVVPVVIELIGRIRDRSRIFHGFESDATNPD